MRVSETSGPSDIEARISDRFALAPSLRALEITRLESGTAAPRGPGAEGDAILHIFYAKLYLGVSMRESR